MEFVIHKALKKNNLKIITIDTAGPKKYLRKRKCIY